MSMATNGKKLGRALYMEVSKLVEAIPNSNVTRVANATTLLGCKLNEARCASAYAPAHRTLQCHAGSAHPVSHVVTEQEASDRSCCCGCQLTLATADLRTEQSAHGGTYQ